MKGVIYAIALFGIACRAIFVVNFGFWGSMAILQWLLSLGGPIAQITANIIAASGLVLLISGLNDLIELI
jgi:hypothetical protein